MPDPTPDTVQYKRISQLPSAPTPLSQSAYVPIVQNGVTYKVTLATLFAAAPQRNYLKAATLEISEVGQLEFVCTSDVIDVESVYINGQQIPPINYLFTTPVITFRNLPYSLEVSDLLIIVYNTVPQGMS